MKPLASGARCSETQGDGPPQGLIKQHTGDVVCVRVCVFSLCCLAFSVRWSYYYGAGLSTLLPANISLTLCYYICM